MASAAALEWGEGWPRCVKDEVVTAVVSDLRLPVRRQIVALVAGLVIDLERSRGEPFRRDWSWGYACRAISGTRRPSNHSQGCAIDLDAPENPYASAATHAAPHDLRKKIAGRLLRTTMPDDVVAIAKRWGFSWGGLYATKPDPMHFEMALTPGEAAELIAELRDLDDHPHPPPPPEEDDMPRPINDRAAAYTLALSWYARHLGRDGTKDPGGLGWWITQLKGRDTDYDVDMLELLFDELAKPERASR